ncbi:hypothetical protein WMY93_033591 [Mugilogobius chulae]|uniref:DM1 domain-containing protein n=1 Tax=Mugilogobius chulae TaxID=88201 RepID=A0AAW0MGM3_9GOBI
MREIVRTDVVTVTPWLAPIVWESTFDPVLLDAIFKPQNLTIAATVFAVGKYIQFLKDFLETLDKFFFVGYNVHIYIFTDRPNEVPKVQTAPGRKVSVRVVPSANRWQEISARRMEMVHDLLQDIRSFTHFVFCLDVDSKFHGRWSSESLASWWPWRTQATTTNPATVSRGGDGGGAPAAGGGGAPAAGGGGAPAAGGGGAPAAGQVEAELQQQVEAELQQQVEAELVEFVVPVENNKTLFVWNLEATRPEHQILVALSSLFSSFGPLYFLKLFPADPGFYSALVKFYSCIQAQRAQRHAHNCTGLQQRPLKVSLSSKKTPHFLSHSRPLSHAHCLNLANHILGFNGWSSDIITLKELEPGPGPGPGPGSGPGLAQAGLFSAALLPLPPADHQRRRCAAAEHRLFRPRADVEESWASAEISERTGSGPGFQQRQDGSARQR